MNREAKQEIRRVLMGRTEPAPDGRLTAMAKGRIRIPLGISDGAAAVRFLGIFRKARRLKVSCPKEKAVSLAAAVMRDCGRELILPAQPGTAACLIRYALTRPAVLVFSYQDGIPLLTAWTGRGLTGLISVRLALKSFIRKMPKQFELSDKAVPPDKEDAPEQKQKNLKKQGKQKKTEPGKAPENGAETDNPENTQNLREEQNNESES